MEKNYAENLLEALERRKDHYDVEKILEALAFAAQAHEGQKRKSGEDYIYHPIEVAKILISYHADTGSVIAALLHDTVEDTDIDLDTVKKRFGEDIALLVDGVTKLNKIMYSSKEEQQIESLRKMLLAMAKDIRVILIKLADRLHNMRTLDSQSPDKQRIKALETIEVYAPLAHRLGIQNLKSELEDISLKYLDPIGYKEITEDLEIFKNNTFFEETKSIIINKLQEENITASVDSRIKHLYSIYRKMFTQDKEFSEIFDLYAYRIIVSSVSECYTVLGYIHDIFHAIPGRLKDYISNPKPNMYQSLHTTVSYKGTLFEVQIRTKEMHKIAEMGIAAHWKYKAGVLGGKNDDEKLRWVRTLLEVQKDIKDDDEFLKAFKIDLFADQVFVSTPKGDIVTLPSEANIIDFAYAIHSQVGNRMVGAKVNGKIAELVTKLQNGDVVEILTSPNALGPSRDWLKLVRTSEAKTKIRQWFKKEKRDENITNGRDLIEKEFRRLNITFTHCTREDLLASFFKRYNCNDLNDFYAAIGYGGITISKILPKIEEEYNKVKQAAIPKQAPEVKTSRKAINGIIVEDIDNCLVRLAHCCVPLPGDDITGFITRGNGVSVHKSDCKNVINTPEERRIRVSWAGKISEYFAATLCIVAVNRYDLAVDITTVLAGMRVLMHSINTSSQGDGTVRIYVKVDVHDIEHLDSVAKRMKKITNVIDVYRTT